MNKILTILLFICFINIQIKAEQQFKDLIVTNKYICGLTDNGQLKLFDKYNGKEIDKNLFNASEILLIASDKTDRLIIADRNNFIKRYDEQKNTWETISKYEGNVYGILSDSKNNYYLITELGIEDVKYHKLYYSDQSLNHQIKFNNKWGKPYCFYIDKSDRIWLGFGYGEWGGNLVVFDTSNRNFLTPILDSFNIALWPIKSFFEDSTSIYLSSGLAHMFTSGTIIRITNLKATTLFYSKSYLSEPRSDGMQTMIPAEYIGPATFNKYNNSIYFYSQSGFFKGIKTKDLSKIENWEIILKPKLHWKGGQVDALGSPMNVLKFAIIDSSKFVFLSQNDGIGFFNGVELTMLK